MPYESCIDIIAVGSLSQGLTNCLEIAIYMYLFFCCCTCIVIPTLLVPAPACAGDAAFSLAALFDSDLPLRGLVPVLNKARE